MPMAGDVLAGRYRIDAALGAGGTAVVYRARDLRLERDIAVKILLPNLARDPLVAGRFDREARALAAASHPGIVAVYDVDRGDPTTGREPFFVMELCDDGSLADALDDHGGRLSPEQLVPMLADIAGGLASLHARGVIHRDVKPHNILICGTGAKLGDFGLARAQDTTRLTAAGTGAGTLAYLAPELLGGAEAGPAADVYGLGVVAFQGLTGRLPRPSASMVDLVDTRLVPAAPISSVAPDLGRAFDAPIAAALAPDPSRRPSPAAFAAALQQALGQWRAQHPIVPVAGRAGRPGDTTQQVRRPPGVPPGGRRRARSIVGPLIAAGLLGTLAAIVILVLVQSLSGVSGPGATVAPTARPSPGASSSAAASASATASPTASPSASPSPSPSPTASPTPTPTPTPAPITPAPTPFPSTGGIFNPALAAQNLQNVNNAIDNGDAAGRFASKADADRLRRAADKVQKGLQKDDGGQNAADAARDLDNTFKDELDKGQVQDTGELRNAIANLRVSLPAAH